MSDIFTGQMIKHNFMNLCWIANIVCLLKPLFNGQNYPTLIQLLNQHIFYAIFTGQIIKQNCFNIRWIANSTGLDDCHFLFPFDVCLNGLIKNINNCDENIFLRKNDACQKGGLCGDSRRASILLGNLRTLFISSSHSSVIDIFVSLLL